MRFLRRQVGGQTQAEAGADEAPEPGEIDADERRHELDLLRGEQDRLDELAQRQLRYAEYSWQPPPQGGDRRADDRDEPTR